MIATSSSDENPEKVKALGASHGINYRQFPAWEEQALEFTGVKCVDILLDVGGGDGLNQSVAAMKASGIITRSASSNG